MLLGVGCEIREGRGIAGTSPGDGIVVIVLSDFFDLSVFIEVNEEVLDDIDDRLNAELDPEVMGIGEGRPKRDEAEEAVEPS